MIVSLNTPGSFEVTLQTFASSRKTVRIFNVVSRSCTKLKKIFLLSFVVKIISVLLHIAFDSCVCMSISINTIRYNFHYFLITRFKQSWVSSSTDGSSHLPKIGKTDQREYQLTHFIELWRNAGTFCNG